MRNIYLKAILVGILIGYFIILCFLSYECGLNAGKIDRLLELISK